MSTLDRTLRKTLADTIIKAREVAEEAARDAIRRLGVIDDEPPIYLSPDQKALRVRLRAHARSLGDGWNSEKKKLLSTRHLEAEAAYEIWHRMLFGRFLVERGLLIHPDLGEPVAPSELADLATEEGEADPWALVERFAAPSLPAVFKPNDPVLAMTLDPALARRLRDLVTGLPTEVFTADDALGWTYQFWRTSEKDAVNKAGNKIGADELPAVTQLFTERYMVQFLLHNTLGAWWAGKYLAANPDFAFEAMDEQALRDACALPGIGWEYLRFVREGENGPWCPAAGSFPGWPKAAGEITYCDPCCGSGHFLVEAFRILAAMRQQEEGLSGADAARAVLRANLHGLELDGRCVQIAAFNVALTAWKVAGSPIPLPQPQIAWVGAPPPMSKSEMADLAAADPVLKGALERLYDQFAQAPLLGSLMEIGARDLLDADLRERGDAALRTLRNSEPERAEGAVAASGLLHAAQLLSQRYVLLATNVPFLGRGKQDPILAGYIEKRMPEAKADLCTAMLEAMRRMAAQGGVVASVTPLNWLFLGSYEAMRRVLLNKTRLCFLVDLGPAAFEEMNWWVARTALIAFSNRSPQQADSYAGLDADTGRDIPAKLSVLRSKTSIILPQREQARNPDARITVQPAIRGELLSKYATSLQGISPADFARFGRFFWEVPNRRDFVYWQSTFDETVAYGGRELVLNKGRALDEAVRAGQAFIRGSDAWGKTGVVVRQMRHLPVSLYTGDAFDTNVAVIVPRNEDDLGAIWAFCSSEEFNSAVRLVDQKVNVTNSTLVKVPFNLRHWKAMFAERYPDGLPEPYSDDPTQWLFHGHPAYADSGTELHVALARLAGFRWPAEIDSGIRLSCLARERAELATKLPGGDSDGLLPLHAGGTERALADRIRALLSVAYGASLTPAREADLVRSSDVRLDKKEGRDLSLEAWLRDRSFRQHCTLFQQRPFFWQVWDGMRDGFSALLHYHRLDHAALEKLTFTLLGDWIAKARAEGRTAHEERALQLQQKLRAILDGEAPYDIFVRWKPLSDQPIGWRPDLDDGVRLNIRPFMTAEVLREQPRINWNKDRGSDTSTAPWFQLGLTYGGKQGDRINDHHLTLAEKRAAHSTAAE